ncbi:hypothetical protein EUX98_g5334 [Antrodiella citrinella]|uniref:DNA replication complex GINS protein SLD5 n=1 Tax=Antrodiella citrinella TaxID=2447956 RepID=A0A4S4MTQ2_9APHY|nr:hypothetical protein EUX98_g5334 [Antrodiella citrinella]
MGWQTICAYVIILPMLAYGMSELLKKRDDVNTTGYLWDFVCTNAAALRDSAVILLREAYKTFVSSDAAAWISHTGIKSQYDMLVSTTKPFVLGAEKATREMLNKTVLVLRMAIYEIETQRSLPSMAVAGHLEREAHIRFMSEKVQDVIIKLAVKYKLQEDDARPHVVRVISGTGSVFLAAGDLSDNTYGTATQKFVCFWSKIFATILPPSAVKELKKGATAVEKYVVDLERTVEVKFSEVKIYVDTVVSATQHFRLEAEKAVNITKFSGELDHLLHQTAENVKEMFPPPDTALGHKGRETSIRLVLATVQDKIVDLAVKHGMNESVVRLHTSEIVQAVEHIFVFIGDLAEQNPGLFTELVIAVVVMAFPESWFLQPLLAAVGFGPRGAIKGDGGSFFFMRTRVNVLSDTLGSFAAWMQRTFFGAAVPKGSFFSYLQSLAMKVGKALSPLQMDNFDWSVPGDDDDDIPMAGPLPPARDVDADDMPAPARIVAPRDLVETPFQQLTRHWMNERHAPDILPAQEALLGRLLDHIRKQTNDVQLLRADPDSSEDEHFRIMLVQTEVERVKFVIRSYLRTRLHKVEKYARYIMSTPETQEKLSQGELDHAERYATILEAHFNNAVLKSLPPEQQGLDDNIAFMPPMIPAPDKNVGVFAYARHACPPVRLPDGTTMEMTPGQIALIPYHVVEHMLLREDIELV